MERIEFKLKELGGIKVNPACKGEKRGMSIVLLEEIEEKLGINLPEGFKSFHSMYGAISFNESVQVKCIEKPDLAREGGLVDVDYFYSLNQKSECSVFEILNDYSDQLPSGYLPICDGEMGDFICICLVPSDFGYIFYWSHEGEEGKDLYKIADTFSEFMLKLEIKKEDEEEDERLKTAKFNPSAKLMEMLKKSGIEPR